MINSELGHVKTLEEFNSEIRRQQEEAHGEDYCKIHDAIVKYMKDCDSYMELGVHQGGTASAAMMTNPGFVQLVDISFEGNKNFSDKYLGSIISSKSNNFYNIFSSGSNLNKANFKFDISKIKSFYKDKGFFDIDVSYSLYNKSLSKYLLIFNIDEGNRYEINNIEYKNSNIDEKNLSKIYQNLDRYLQKKIRQIENFQFFYFRQFQY